MGNPPDLSPRAHGFLSPIKPTDERTLQEFFYSLPDQDIYYRFLSAMKVFPHRNTQGMCNIDYEHEMAIVGVTGEIGNEKLIAIGRYILDQKTNLAEVDFAVAAPWQRMGMAPSCCTTSVKLPRARGSAVLPHTCSHPTDACCRSSTESATSCIRFWTRASMKSHSASTNPLLHASRKKINEINHSRILHQSGRIAFDIDGVVADTMEVFVRLAHERYSLMHLTKETSPATICTIALDSKKRSSTTSSVSLSMMNTHCKFPLFPEHRKSYGTFTACAPPVRNGTHMARIHNGMALSAIARRFSRKNHRYCFGSAGRQARHPQ